MRSLHRFFGPAGVVLLLFGLVSYGLTGRLDAWTAVHVAGGAGLLVASIGINFGGFRRSATSRGTRERAQALTGALLFCGVLATVNVVAARYPWRYDATENRMHTLTPKTLALVRGLEEPVALLAFLEAGDPAKAQLEALLERYAALGPKLTWRFVDAEREPHIADQMGVRRLGVVVARRGEATAQTLADSAGGFTEGTITNLLLKVTQPGPKVIYALTGHGEPDIDDLERPDGLALLAEALRGESFEVRPLLLSTAPAVPEDASILLVAGPRKPLIAHEEARIRDFLAGGGRALLLVDPGVDSGLASLLSDYRVRLGDTMIVDQEQIPFLGARLGVDPIVDDFPLHPATGDFKERIVLLQARSVDPASEGGIEGLEVRSVARTGYASWAERDYRSMLATGRVSRDPSDASGPVSVAVAVSLPDSVGDDPETGRSGTRLVVVGDSDLAINANLDAYFNREFLVGLVQWLAGRDALVAEGPRGMRPSRLDMTEADYRTLFRFGVLLLPESLLILGLGVWWRRRSL